MKIHINFKLLFEVVSKFTRFPKFYANLKIFRRFFTKSKNYSFKNNIIYYVQLEIYITHIFMTLVFKSYSVFMLFEM
jgi:hypothetical protein